MTPGLALDQAQAILDAANAVPPCTRWDGCEKGTGHDGGCRRTARPNDGQWRDDVYGMSRAEWDQYGKD